MKRNHLFWLGALLGLGARSVLREMGAGGFRQETIGRVYNVWAPVYHLANVYLLGQLPRFRGLAVEKLRLQAGDSVLDLSCGAPRGAVTIIPERKGGKPVGSAVYLNTVEADPAGGGPQARTRLEPGKHAARGGTPSRPRGCKPKPEHGYARNLCQKRPEGQHPGKRWRWGGSHRVTNWSHGS